MHRRTTAGSSSVEHESPLSDGEPDAPASSAFLVPSSCRMVTQCIQYPTVTCMVVRFFTCFQEPSELVLTCPEEPGSTNFNCAGGGSPRLGLVWPQTTGRESCFGIVGWGGTVHCFLHCARLVVSVLTVLCQGLATVCADCADAFYRTTQL
jgi:hypothetical protein